MEQIHETYERQEDGTTILIKSEVVIIPQEVIDQQVIDKEAELLKVYEELQALKNKTTI